MWLDRSGKTVSVIGAPEATDLIDVDLGAVYLIASFRSDLFVKKSIKSRSTVSQ